MSLSNIFRLAAALKLGNVEVHVRSFGSNARAMLVPHADPSRSLHVEDGATPEIAISLLEQQLTARLTREAEGYEKAAEAARKALAEVTQ